MWDVIDGWCVFGFVDGAAYSMHAFWTNVGATVLAVGNNLLVAAWLNNLHEDVITDSPGMDLHAINNLSTMFFHYACTKPRCEAVYRLGGLRAVRKYLEEPAC